MLRNRRGTGNGTCSPPAHEGMHVFSGSALLVIVHNAVPRRVCTAFSLPLSWLKPRSSSGPPPPPFRDHLLHSLPRAISSAKKDGVLSARKDALQTNLGALLEEAADTKRPVEDENVTSNKEVGWSGWDV